MASPFSRTYRSLHSEPTRGPILGLVSVVLLLALWSAWLVSARLPVYVASDAARLEVTEAVHPVTADAAGRIVEVRAAVGQEVRAGEVLFRLDAELERRRLDEETARREGLGKEIESLRAALRSEALGLTDARAAARAAIAEARSRHAAELAAVDLAEEEAARSAQLHAQGLASEMELRRARAQAAERRSGAQALEQAVTRLTSVGRREARERRARMDQIERQVAERVGGSEISAAAARRLEEEIARRSIRAPVAGRLGEVGKVRPGSVVAAGDRLATVIPVADLKVVASFPPSAALARIRRGQPAQLRLDGFPWTEYGSLRAEVTRVAGEVRDGRLWIECAMAPDEGSPIPLQHGLPGTLVVEIERLSPAALVLRSVGKVITGSPRQGTREGSGVEGR